MVDLNRLLGFVFYSENDMQSFKKALCSVSPKLEMDDIAVIGDDFCVGPGEITGHIANFKESIENWLPPYDVFLSRILDTAKAMGKVDTDKYKILFVITDQIDLNLDNMLAKIEKMNDSLDFGLSIHFIEVCEACVPCKFPKSHVDDDSELTLELQTILERYGDS